MMMSGYQVHFEATMRRDAAEADLLRAMGVMRAFVIRRARKWEKVAQVARAATQDTFSRFIVAMDRAVQS